MPRHRRYILSTLFFALVVSSIAHAQGTTSTIVIRADAPGDTISRFIYGQFAEHLGRGIYEGIWVGEESPISNTRGLRNDVVEALKAIKVSAIRWPGGCFADEYHWKDGIGPKAKRPKLVNTSWGGVVEDNSFGTHEFMDLCEMLGAEPVICGNVGSGTVQEMSDWVQYLTSEDHTPMSQLRKQHGREKPWKVRFWGVGNESWGCGGIMTAEYYASELARFSRFLKNYDGNSLVKIASGGLPWDYAWTETIMKKWAGADGWLQDFMGGYSLHFYTVDWNNKGSATQFSEREWFKTLRMTMEMDTVIARHTAIMDKYDPQNRIGLFVDEWGTWLDVEPGTNAAFLYQQNSLRDALVAAVNFNIFHKHARRVKMANIAQMVNVLQAMILTRGKEIVLTPTYHVFKMYSVHQDAVALPVELTTVPYTQGDDSIPALSATASRDGSGTIHISIANLHPSKAQEVRFEVNGIAGRKISGSILTGDAINAFNDFGKPERVTIKTFSPARRQGESLTATIPARSVVTLQLDQ